MEDEIVKRPVGRPPLHRTTDRPEMHVEDPRERARRREEEILSGGLNFSDSQDEFYIDPKDIPEGWSYEWKRYSVLNEIQTNHLSALMANGWAYVTPEAYPKIPPTSGLVIQRGNVLMERPLAITQKFIERDKRLAQLQVDTKAAQIEGSARAKIGSEYDVTNKGDPIRARGVAGAKKTYAPIPVPE